MQSPTASATGTSFIDRLRAIVGADGLLASPSELVVYECDGYTIAKNKPDVVVFPTTTEQVVQVVKACGEAGVPFLPRGAGTSLAGGRSEERRVGKEGRCGRARGK